MKEFFVSFFVLVLGVEGISAKIDTCIHGGVKYNDGDYFPPNRTVIQTDGPQQCVYCRCHRGFVLCEIEDCPLLDCEAPVRRPESCCLYCPGSSMKKIETVRLNEEKTGSVSSSKKCSKSECNSSEKHVKKKRNSNPPTGPVGVMACVQCHCPSENVCPKMNGENFDCPEAQMDLQKCGFFCFVPVDEKNREQTCLSKNDEYFVFKDNSEKIEYALVENLFDENLVKIHMWSVDAKKLEEMFSTSEIPEEPSVPGRLEVIYTPNKRKRR